MEVEKINYILSKLFVTVAVTSLGVFGIFCVTYLG